MRAYYTGEEKCTNPWYPPRRCPAVVLEVQTHNIPISCDSHHPPLRVHRGKWVAVAWTTPGIQEDTGSLMSSHKKVKALPTLCVTPSQPRAYLVQPRAPVVRCVRETPSHGGDEAAGGSTHPMTSPPLVLHCSAPTWCGRGSGPFVVSLVRCSVRHRIAQLDEKTALAASILTHYPGASGWQSPSPHRLSKQCMSIDPFH
uniref:Uncharacterized protein TCIL3000_5_3460 n=1 Tax=Trypanosoma congolense (strain IL3000) TaxID=1068625 RepID=G0ULV3_TRYCI|nr:unnamed protein product [Trypanosoma congolense IL3000]